MTDNIILIIFAVLICLWFLGHAFFKYWRHKKKKKPQYYEDLDKWSR